MDKEGLPEGRLEWPMRKCHETDVCERNVNFTSPNKEQVIDLSTNGDACGQQKEVSVSNSEQVEVSSQNYKYSNDGKETSANDSLDRTKELKTELWPSNTVILLITKFEELHCQLHGESLKKKHWESLVSEVNRLCNKNFSWVQCKEKWQRLTKTYRKEKRNLVASGAKTSFWSHYKVMERIVGKPQKNVPSTTGYTGMEWKGESDVATKRKRTIIESVEEHASKQIEQMQVLQANAGGVEGKYVKSAKYALDSVTETMRENTQQFLETMKEIEYKRMEHEGKLMDKMLEMQLQIAKLFAQK